MLLSRKRHTFSNVPIISTKHEFQMFPPFCILYFHTTPFTPKVFAVLWPIFFFGVCYYKTVLQKIALFLDWIHLRSKLRPSEIYVQEEITKTCVPFPAARVSVVATEPHGRILSLHPLISHFSKLRNTTNLFLCFTAW